MNINNPKNFDRIENGNANDAKSAVFEVPDVFKKNSYIDFKKYQKLYAQSISNPDQFWSEQAEIITWYKKFDKVKDVSFHSPVKINWYLGGKLNVSYNCIDRHLPQNKNRVAYIFEPDNPTDLVRKITYGELYDEVNRMANVLKHMGVQKGDRVTIYMPMIPEAVFAMLACARIGAVHSLVFGGFSAESLVDRIVGCDSNYIITADQGMRGGKRIPLKDNVDVALTHIPGVVKKVLVIAHTHATVNWAPERDLWWHEAMSTVSDYCEPEVMDAEDPLFLLFTSGSTNKPKGVLHTTGGYLVYAALTHKYVFDYHPEDIFWCTADVGWVTGHSYIVYGPLANCATSVLFEGVPNYPTPSRFWEVVDKHKVSIFYTAPTALRALMREGESYVKKTSRASLRLLGSVGEPINPEAWLWYHRNVGDSRCPIVDTWWQTETGGILISPLPGATDLKPGSATLPFFGVEPVMLTMEGQEIKGEGDGVLCLKNSWPGQMRTVFREHERFEQTYFSNYKGLYFTGDGCRRDADGYYWITGRVDDVLNVSGHRLGTAEIESALVAHYKVAEAAVVGCHHDIKGQGIYVFVTLKSGYEPQTELEKESLKKELQQHVRQEISAIATPDYIQWANQGLPKTRSGKIMRRILRKIVENADLNQLGDTSTLADPSVVESLYNERLLK